VVGQATFLQQAQRFGAAALVTQRERARRERCLGELAEPVYLPSLVAR